MRDCGRAQAQAVAASTALTRVFRGPDGPKNRPSGARLGWGSWPGLSMIRSVPNNDSRTSLLSVPHSLVELKALTRDDVELLNVDEEVR